MKDNPKTIAQEESTRLKALNVKATNNPLDGDEPHPKDNDNKKLAVGATAPAPSSSSSLPQYGTLEYWQARYQRNAQTTSLERHNNNNNKNNNSNTNTSRSSKEQIGDDPVAYFAWYFSYDELRPLILPLILGSDESSEDGDGDDDENSDAAEQQQEEEKVPTGETALISEPDEDDGREKADEPSDNNGGNGEVDELEKNDGRKEEVEEGVSEEEQPSEKCAEEKEENVELEEGVGGANDEEEWVEVGDSDDEEEEEISVRIGLAQSGPICILEIGCGDVPLGAGLTKDLLDLEKTTGTSALKIVQQIICIDYSSTVVETMQKQYYSSTSAPTSTETAIEEASTKTTDGERDSKRLKTDQPDNEDADTAPSPPAPPAPPRFNIRHIPLEFAAIDARDLPYAGESVDLILEKGTLDAMLSDQEQGRINCVQTVAECARVLTPYGYLVLVSHLNAHTSAGMDWLDKVVCAGLRTTKNATWEIEVHGKQVEVPPARDDDVDDTKQEGHKEEKSAGPAVYIVHKKPVVGDEPITSTGTTIPIKFCAY